MSNKLIKNKKPEKETSVKEYYGRVLLVCGIVWLGILMVMWIFPTNLDGKPLKLIISIVWLMFGILQCVIGIYWMVKKPKVKLGKFMAKIMVKTWRKEILEESAKELPKEVIEELEDEMVESMKDFEF